jgi:hypothetical protein
MSKFDNRVTWLEERNDLDTQGPAEMAARLERARARLNRLEHPRSPADPKRVEALARALQGRR